MTSHPRQREWICNQTHTFKAIKCLWYQLQGDLTKPAMLLPASSKLLIRIRNETAGGCRIMLLWKPLQVCGPRNNKPQIFRVCKKKKWGRKGKKTDWNKYHKPKALQALLKGGHNSIVKRDLPGRTLQRTKEFSCKKYPGVCQKKGRRKQN